MANRAEMSGGQQMMDRSRVSTKVHRLFQLYPGDVSFDGDMLSLDPINSTFLKRERGPEDIVSGLTFYERKSGDIEFSQTLEVFCYEDQPTATIAQRKTGHTSLVLEYTHLSGDRFVLPNETTIRIPADSNEQKTVYRFSDKKPDCKSSIDLMVEENAEGLLVVRDDYGVKGLMFPRSFTIDDELRKFEEKLKRK